MSIAVQAELPDDLVAEARRFIEAGGVGDFNSLLTEALRRFLDSHSEALGDSFLKEDVEWGLHGRN